MCMTWTETDLEIERDKIRLWFVQQMRDKIARSDLSLPDQHCVNISYIHLHRATVLVPNYSSPYAFALDTDYAQLLCLRRIDVAYNQPTFF
jgi:hypothetical protein